MPKKFEVKYRDTWVTCKKAAPVGRGFLHYELFDGTSGVAQQGTWREKGQLESKVGTEKRFEGDDNDICKCQHSRYSHSSTVTHACDFCACEAFKFEFGPPTPVVIEDDDNILDI